MNRFLPYYFQEDFVMKKPVFTGASVAIITPFTADNKINYEEFGKMIDVQIAKGTDAITVCGTTGESACMTDEEHRACIEFCVKHVAGRVPVIAGTGSNDTNMRSNFPSTQPLPVLTHSFSLLPTTTRPPRRVLSSTTT